MQPVRNRLVAADVRRRIPANISEVRLLKSAATSNVEHAR